MRKYDNILVPMLVAVCYFGILTVCTHAYFYDVTLLQHSKSIPPTWRR